MKKFFIFFLLIPLFFLSACSISSDKANNKIPSNTDNSDQQPVQNKDVNDVDEEIGVNVNKDVEDLGNGWRWEKGILYFHDLSTKLDRDSFQILNDKYVKDKNGVYFCYLNGCSLEDRDSETFVVLDNFYQKDKNGIYRGSEKIIGADPESFNIISDVLSRDNSHVFSGLKEIADADPFSFKVLNKNFSKDSRHVFFKEKIAIGLDAETFTVLNDNYAKDKAGVYYYKDYQDYYVKFSANSGDFEVLSDGYTRNKTEVFYNGKKIMVSDLASFSVVGGGYAKDDSHIYFKGESNYQDIEKNYQLYLLRNDSENCSTTKHPAKDLNSYIDLGQGYGKDSQCAFYFDWPIDKGHAASFKVLDKNYSIDRNYAYYARPDYKDIIRINGSIPSSFKLIGQGFAGDEEHIYFGAIGVYADTATFKAINPEDNKWGFNGEDKDAYYKGTERTLKFLAK